jgi:predicted protein tyrosine phosphatase
MQRLLFVCSQNRFRSPTAEAVVTGLADVEAASAGLNHDAVTPLSGDLIEWADIIFVMETTHRNKLQKRFRNQLRGKRVVTLGIPDIYEFMEPVSSNCCAHLCAATFPLWRPGELLRQTNPRSRHVHTSACQAPNKQLQRTVIRRRGDAASAPFHYALAPLTTRQRAAAELRR